MTKVLPVSGRDNQTARDTGVRLVIGGLVACMPAAFPAPATCDESGLLPSIHRTWQTFTVREGLPHDTIRAIHASGERIWVGTEGGLALRRGDTWKSWTKSDGLPWPVISAIDIDDVTEDVWLGTWGGGLVRFSSGRFDRFDQFNSGLAGNLVFAVAVAGGRVWAATNAGLSSFNPVNGEWDLHNERKADAPETVIIDLLVRGSNLFAVSWCEGLRRFDLTGGRWMLLDHPPTVVKRNQVSGAVSYDTSVALAGSNRSIWWATQSELYRFDGRQRWNGREMFAGQGNKDFVSCLAAPNESSVWIGTNRGLRVLADWSTGTWISFRQGSDGQPGRVIARRDGRVLDARALTSIPDDRIRCIDFGEREVWVGTSRGLACGAHEVPWSDLQSADTEGSCRQSGALTRTAGITSSQQLHRPDSESPAPPTIGVFVPITAPISLPGEASQPTGRTHGADLLAVQLAASEVNNQGGYRGQSAFSVAIGMSGFGHYGWGTPEDDLIFFAYERDVLGTVGYWGPERRILSAVAMRTELPLVNAAPLPATIDETVNPWIFRCRTNDPRQHHRLLDYVFDEIRENRVAILRTPDRLSQMHLNWWSGHARDRGHAPVADLDFDPEGGDVEPMLREIRRCEASVVVTWCDARVSGNLLHRLRDAGMRQVFVGSDQIVSEEFLALLGKDPGRVIAPFPCAHRRNPAAVARFAEEYSAKKAATRTVRSADLDAYLSFNASLHLMEAINVAGRDREAIRKSLSRMSQSTIARLEEGRWTALILAGVP